MLLTVLFCLMAIEEPVPYYVVLKNKKVMTVKEAPSCQGRLCKVTLLNGQVTSLPAKLIDTVETDRYNTEKAEKREQERLAKEAEAAANEKAKAKREARRKNKHIAITVDEALPKYERNPNTQAKQAVEEGDVPMAEPTVNTFQSADPVYVSREIITTYSDHCDVELQIMVNHSKGANDIKVNLKVSYENESADNMEKSIPGRTAFQKTATVTFRLDKTDAITRTNHKVTAVIEE